MRGTRLPHKYRLWEPNLAQIRPASQGSYALAHPASYTMPTVSAEPLSSLCFSGLLSIFGNPKSPLFHSSYIDVAAMIRRPRCQE